MSIEPPERSVALLLEWLASALWLPDCGDLVLNQVADKVLTPQRVFAMLKDWQHHMQKT